MSLLKREKEKKIAAAEKLAARHPVLNLEIDRNVRDAYIHGLVFTAVANDDRIDDAERKWLEEVGESLELNADDIADPIRTLVALSDNDMMLLVEECARQLSDVRVAEYFMKQFEEVWLLGGGGDEEFAEFEKQLVSWMGDDVKDAVAEAERIAKESEAKAAGERRMAKRAELAAKLVEIIEGDDSWPVEFKPSEYEELFRAAEVEDVKTFVAESLFQKFKDAFELAKGKIGEAKIVHDQDDDERNGVRFETVREYRILFRYAFFFDAYFDLVSLSKDYYFCGPGEYDSDYYNLNHFGLGKRHISAERREKTQWPAIDGWGGLLSLTETTLDRLRCHYSVWEDEAEEYFSQWTRLFSEIENGIAVRSIILFGENKLK